MKPASDEVVVAMLAAKVSGRTTTLEQKLRSG